MEQQFYNQLAEQCIAGKVPSRAIAADILSSNDIELIALLNAAYTIRKKFAGNKVTIHIINNAQNGYCPEDCHYCAQAKSSDANIEEYPLKSDQEILLEAKSAYQKGAHRYCMVFAGRGPSRNRVVHLLHLVVATDARVERVAQIQSLPEVFVL